mgnify:FL=1
MAMLLSAWVYMAGAQLCFWLPLNRRPDFARRAALCLAADFAMAALVMAGVTRCGLSIPGFVAISAGFMVWSAVATRLCTPLNTPGSVYCAVWVLLVAETAHELWLMLVWTAEQRLHWTFVPAMQPVTLVLYYLLLRYTAARTMPQAGSYRIGPRQLVSGLLLSAIFVVQSVVLLFQRGEDVNSALVVSAVLTQLYCLTLLYLQTELFKKSAMKKEMDMLNLLYERQRRQYLVARKNVQLINKRCHDLKVQIADLRRLAPAAAEAQLREAEAAAAAYDTAADTGNEVLDVVLTEKTLLCQADGIRLHSVADGRCMRFLEAGDLYTLFSNVLDLCIQQAKAVPEPEHRMIDLVVVHRQGFAVISVAVPTQIAAPKEDYPLKVIRRIVEGHNGVLTCESAGGFYTVKILFPT